MDSLVKTVSNKNSSPRDKTDAYLTMMQHLCDGDAEIAENSIRNHIPNLLKVLKLHIGIKMKSKDVSLAALKALGAILSRTNLVKLTSDSMLTDIMEGLCELLVADKEKQFHVSSFWCIANQTIPSNILSKYVSKVVSCLSKHNSSAPSGTIMVEGFNALKRLCDMCPDEMENELENYIDAVFKGLEPIHLFPCAVGVLATITPMLLKKSNFAREYVAKHLNQQGLGVRVSKHFQDGACRIPFIKLWICFAKIFGETFFHLDQEVRHPMFTVLQQAFKSTNLEVQCALYDMWIILIDDTDDIDKRKNVLLNPLQLYRYYESPVSAERCLKTYWYLICKIGGKVNENIEKIILPILETLISSKKKCTSPNKENVAIEDYMTPVKDVAGSKNLTKNKKNATPKVLKHTTPSSNLAEMAVEMLFVLLSSPDDRKNMKGTKLDPFFGPKISTEHLFRHSSKFLAILLEAAKMYPFGNNDMLSKTWVLFLLEMQTEGFGNVKQVWGNIFAILRIIIEQELGTHEFILKVSPLLPLSDSHKEIVCKGNEKGYPALFILQSLLHQKFMKEEIYEDEKFFVLYQKMIQVLFGCISGQLATVDTIFVFLNDVKNCMHDGISWRLWSTLSHELMHYVSLTNEVNQGSVAEVNFNAVLKSLLYPLDYIDMSKLKAGEKNTLLETWGELYEIFERAISLLPGVDENLILGDLCKAIIVHITKDVKKSIDLLIKMLWMIVKSETFDVPTTKTVHLLGVQINSPKLQKDGQCEENFTEFLKCLKLLVSKLIDENLGLVSRNADKYLLEVVEIIKFFFEQLNRYKDLYQAINCLNETILNLFDKYSNGKLLSQLDNLTESILSTVENASNVLYEDEFLNLLEPLLIKTISVSRRKTKLRTVLFWNNTFSKNRSVSCSTSLRDSLKNSKTPTKAIIWESNNSEPILCEYPVDSQFTESIEDTPVMHTPTSGKMHGSFLPSNKQEEKTPLFSPADKSHSPRHSTKKYVRRRSKANKADEFVEIKEAPRKSRLLTEHQKEVKREKKVIPLMYNSLDQSQDTLLFQAFSQELSNSQHTNQGNNSDNKGSTSNQPNSTSVTNCIGLDIDAVEPVTPRVENLMHTLEPIPDLVADTSRCVTNEESNPTLVAMSSCDEEEDESCIPSSQTQESFSQLRSPFVDNNGKMIAKVAESPEESLVNVSLFSNFQHDDTGKVNAQILPQEKLKSSLFESNKENTILEETFSKISSENLPIVSVVKVSETDQGNNIDNSSLSVDSIEKCDSLKKTKRGRPSRKSMPILKANDDNKGTHMNDDRNKKKKTGQSRKSVPILKVNDVNQGVNGAHMNDDRNKKKKTGRSRKSVPILKVNDVIQENDITQINDDKFLLSKRKRICDDSEEKLTKKHCMESEIEVITRVVKIESGIFEQDLVRRKSIVTNKSPKVNNVRSNRSKYQHSQKHNLHNFLQREKIIPDSKSKESLNSKEFKIKVEPDIEMTTSNILMQEETNIQLGTYQPSELSDEPETASGEQLQSQQEQQQQQQQQILVENQHLLSQHQPQEQKSFDSTEKLNIQGEDLVSKPLHLNVSTPVLDICNGGIKPYGTGDNSKKMDQSNSNVVIAISNIDLKKPNTDSCEEKSLIDTVQPVIVTTGPVVSMLDPVVNTTDAELVNNVIGQDIDTQISKSTENKNEKVPNTQNLSCSSGNSIDFEQSIMTDEAQTSKLSNEESHSVNNVNTDQRNTNMDPSIAKMNLSGSYMGVQAAIEICPEKQQIPSQSSCSLPNNVSDSETNIPESTTPLVKPNLDPFTALVVAESLPEDLKKPYINNFAISPIQNISSPNASPVNGILKKRSFLNQSPSPPFKNRRVSFQLPEGASFLNCDDGKQSDKWKKRKQKSPATTCIFPELVDCTTPIEKILPTLTFSRGVGHLVRAQNILTVGDLSALSEAQVENLPIRSPKLRTVRNALSTFSSQQIRGKAILKSPLSMEKLSDLSSPRKGELDGEGTSSLLMTPSKHSNVFKPITLFHHTPVKEVKSPSNTNESKNSSGKFFNEESGGKFFNEESSGKFFNEESEGKQTMEGSKIEKGCIEPKEKLSMVHGVEQVVENGELISKTEILITKTESMISKTESMITNPVLEIESVLEEVTDLGKELISKFTRKKDGDNEFEEGKNIGEKDLNASFRITSVDDSFENSFEGCHKIRDLSPIKKLPKVTEDIGDTSFEDPIDADSEEVCCRRLNVVDSDIKDVIVNAVNEEHIVEDIVVSLCEKTEVLCATDIQKTPTKGLTTSENELPSITASNISHYPSQTINNSRKMDVEKTNSTFISECYLSPNVKTSSVSSSESICTSAPCDEKVTNALEEIKLTHNLAVQRKVTGSIVESIRLTNNDMARLTTADLFDLVEELDKTKVEVMRELKIRMLQNHNTANR